jgi:predicted DNA-binding transcriptional regulator AlpA
MVLTPPPLPVAPDKPKRKPKPKPQVESLGYTIEEFCAAVGISRSCYYALPPDQRPFEKRIGPRRIIISRQAADEWMGRNG